MPSVEFELKEKLMTDVSCILLHRGQSHEGVWGNGNIVLRILSLAVNWGELSASRSCRFTPGGKSPCPSWLGGRIGHRTNFGLSEELLACTENRTPIPRLSITYPSRYTECAICLFSVHETLYVAQSTSARQRLACCDCECGFATCCSVYICRVHFPPALVLFVATCRRTSQHNALYEATPASRFQEAFLSGLLVCRRKS